MRSLKKLVLTNATLVAALAGPLLGCHHDQPDMSKTNRLNSATSTGNSQQATEPPTNPDATRTTSGSGIQP